MAWHLFAFQGCVAVSDQTRPADRDCHRRVVVGREPRDVLL